VIDFREHFFTPRLNVYVPGAPHPDLSKGMEEEHCVKAGCNDEFTSLNYGVRTTPCKEFNIAAGRIVCPQEDMLDKMRKKVRVVRGIEELKRLDTAKKAGLTEEEIMAVVLNFSSAVLCASYFSL
jgi:hypothetical protein